MPSLKQKAYHEINLDPNSCLDIVGPTLSGFQSVLACFEASELEKSSKACKSCGSLHEHSFHLVLGDQQVACNAEGQSSCKQKQEISFIIWNF